VNSNVSNILSGKPAISFLCVGLLLLLFSCKTAKLSDAIAKEERGEYHAAAQVYRKVYTKTPSQKKFLRGSIAYHLADCYRKTGATQKALTAYNNAVRCEYADSMAILYAAKMSQKLGRYREAAKLYSDFLEIVPASRDARNGLKGCDSAQVWKQNPLPYTVKRLEIALSRDGEFSPVITGDKADQILFSSSRKGVVGDSVKSLITGARNNDFFLLKQNEKGAWLKPEHIDSDINTEYDEGAACLSPDGQTLYYTFCAEEPGIPKTADIYSSSRSGAQWGAGQRVAIWTDTLNMAAHPAVGTDGYLYFVSDVPGGYGGKDIWRIQIDRIGKGKPENLGPYINTAGDEMFPFFRDDSTLYFASDGHPGMGGLDIFRAIPTSKGWKVENMKSPVNSNADDFGIVFEPQKNRGYFSSSRNDARGVDHIYSFEYPEFTVKIEGWVLDREEEIIDNAFVKIVGKDGSNRKFIVKTDGTYQAEIVKGMEYVMMGGATDYLNQKQTITVPDEEKSETYYVDFYLPSISKPVLIENIFYDFDRATLRPESREALDEIIVMLEDNPNVTVELSAHTDRKGSEEYNRNLSQRRAQAVVDYLIAGGTDPQRLSPVGYGKSQPKAVPAYIARDSLISCPKDRYSTKLLSKPCRRKKGK